MIPYSRQNIDEHDLEAVRAALSSDWLTQGPCVPLFEEQFSALHAVDHAIAVSNATAALHLGCLALGVGPGSRVWTSPNSFVASANCARYCGASVDFVDIDARSRNMSIAALEAKLSSAQRSGSLPDVVVPVDFSGLPCDLQEMRELADRYGFKILEDASHAVGAEYRGRPIGSRFADISVFSFHAVKIITTAEGGMLTTQNAELAKRLRLLRSHGITRDPSMMETTSPPGAWYYEQIDLGLNYRMTDLAAALGSSQLQRLEALRERRRALAERYCRLLEPLPVTRPLSLPDRESSHHLYVIELEEAEDRATRAEVFARMRTAGIGVNVHYIPIHLQPYYRRLGFEPGAFPTAERYYSRALTLPLFPALTEAEQDKVVHALCESLGR